MKDIPFFTTKNGAVGLALQEVPYRHRVYITIHSAEDLDVLLDECVSFCKAVGAQQVYACNHEGLRKYPVYTEVLEMRVKCTDFPETDVSLVPVTEATLSMFVEIYNKKMAGVATAKFMTSGRAKEILAAKSGYFAYQQDTLVGIGVSADGEISAVASVRKGAGREVMLALCTGLHCDTIRLEVASTNEKAIRLYKSLGFACTEVKNTWYQIL